MMNYVLHQSFQSQQWCPHSCNNALDDTLIATHHNQVSFLQRACTSGEIQF